MKVAGWAAFCRPRGGAAKRSRTRFGKKQNKYQGATALPWYVFAMAEPSAHKVAAATTAGELKSWPPKCREPRRLQAATIKTLLSAAFPYSCKAPAVQPQAEQVFSRGFAGCRLAGRSARGTGGGRGGQRPHRTRHVPVA